MTYYLLIAVGKRYRSLPFLRALARNETQTASFGVCIRVTDIFHDTKCDLESGEFRYYTQIHSDMEWLHFLVRIYG